MNGCTRPPQIEALGTHAAENVIPASSGVAKALGFIWPKVKITGKAYRVPVRTGMV